MSEHAPITVVFALFPRATQLDFTAPHEVFSLLPGAEVVMASVEGGTLKSSGLCFAGLRRLADIPTCDVICVPGGYGAPPTSLARTTPFLPNCDAWPARRASLHRYVGDRWRSMLVARRRHIPRCCLRYASEMPVLNAAKS